MLYFEKVDETFFIVSANTDEGRTELRELRRNFRVEHPEKKHIKSYQNGQWDGYIKFIDFLDSSDEIALAPIGLFKMFNEYMIDFDIDFKIKGDRVGINKLDFSNFDEWLDDLEEERDKKITNRKFQYDAVKKLLQYNRAVLTSPTGSGKSLIIYTYIMWILENEFEDGENFLLVVPSTTLVNQMANDFIEYGMPEEWISKIYSGTKKDFTTPLVISTWQSLYKKDNKFFDNFNGLVIDEAHKAKSTEMVYIAENCVNARFRLATTGTLHRNTAFRWSVIANFGPVVDTKTTRELIKDGILTDFDIVNIVLYWKKNNGSKRITFNFNDYQEELEMIVNSTDRMDYIIKQIKNIWNDREYENATLLVMGKRVQYIEDLFVRLQEDMKKDVFFIHGKVSVKDRDKIINHVKNKGGIVIANVNIMGTGINIPNVFGIIFANPIKSDITLLQTIGRSIRLFDDKVKAIIYDFVDKIPSINGMNTTFQWLSNTKIPLYNDEDFYHHEVDTEIIINVDDDDYPI